MKLCFGHAAVQRSGEFVRRLMMIGACAGILAGCGFAGPQTVTAPQPRGASVAFESIDGPPPGQFQTLVRNLNDEAQSRRLAVISRESVSVYRVRGYLAAKVVKGRTTISWVWDVFDRDRHRALRIEGEETGKEIDKADGKDASKGARSAWSVADDAMLRRIAHASMERLAEFLTSPDAGPATAAIAAIPAVYTDQQIAERATSPEAAGIFRIFQPQADPASSGAAEEPAITGELAGDVPLPPRRPGDPAISAEVTAEMSAASL